MATRIWHLQVIWTEKFTGMVSKTSAGACEAERHRGKYERLVNFRPDRPPAVGSDDRWFEKRRMSGTLLIPTGPS